jgi:uncharacterized repeat protein (TIGR01451 family)
MGDSLVLVFPVAATGNVAATSLTLIDVLGAGLDFVSAFVDYGESLGHEVHYHNGVLCSIHVCNHSRECIACTYANNCR